MDASSKMKSHANRASALTENRMKLKAMLREQQYRGVTIPIAKASRHSRVVEGIALKIIISVYQYYCY